PIAAAAGGAGAAVVIAAIIAFILIRRRRRKNAAQNGPVQITSDSPVPGGRVELHADSQPGQPPVPLQELPPNEEKTSSGQVAGYYSPTNGEKLAHMADSTQVVEMPVSSTPTLVNSPYAPPPPPQTAATPAMSPVSAVS